MPDRHPEHAADRVARNRHCYFTPNLFSSR